jgi:hypothetical protein
VVTGPTSFLATRDPKFFDVTMDAPRNGRQVRL